MPTNNIDFKARMLDEPYVARCSKAVGVSQYSALRAAQCAAHFEDHNADSGADLRDTKHVPQMEEGGIEAFPPNFYKPQPLRMQAEIDADILAIEQEAEGLLDDMLVEALQP